MQDEKKSFVERLLVVVDDSAESDNAFSYALDFSLATGALMNIAYVVDSASMDYLGKLHILIAEEQELFAAEMEMCGRRTLQRLKKAALDAGVEADTYLLRGRVHQSVLKAAQELNAETIVLAGWKNIYTRKDTTSMERQLIMDQAQCPVILIKNP